jgi:hypothetical protein
MAEEKRTTPFQMRMRPSVKAAGERAAADDGRSLNSYIEKLLVDDLRANGYLPKLPGAKRPGARKA